MADASPEVRTALAVAAHVSNAVYSALGSSSVAGATSADRVNATLQATAASHGFEPGRFVALHKHASQDAVVILDTQEHRRLFVSRGTFSFRDVVTDMLGFAPTGYSRRLDTTVAAARHAYAEAAAAGDDFVAVGHSLGGALARAVGAVLGVPYVALNAPMMQLTGPLSPLVRQLADALFPWPAGTVPPPHVSDAELSAAFAAMPPGAGQEVRRSCDALSALTDGWGWFTKEFAAGDALSYFSVAGFGPGGSDSCHGIGPLSLDLSSEDSGVRLLDEGTSGAHPPPAVAAALHAARVRTLHGLMDAALSMPDARGAALRAIPKAVMLSSATAALGDFLTAPLAATAGDMLATGAASLQALAAGGSAAHALAGFTVAALRGDDAAALAAARSFAPSVLLSAVFGEVVTFGRTGFVGRGPQYASYSEVCDHVSVGLPKLASGGVHLGVVVYTKHDGTEGTMRVVGAHAELLAVGAAVRFGASTEASRRTYVDGDFTYHVFEQVDRCGVFSVSAHAGNRVVALSLPALGPTYRYGELHQRRTDGTPHTSEFTPGAGALSLTAPESLTFALPDGQLRSAALPAALLSGGGTDAAAVGGAVAAVLAGTPVAAGAEPALLRPTTESAHLAPSSLPAAAHAVLHERTVADMREDVAGRLGTRVDVFDKWQKSYRKTTAFGERRAHDEYYHTGKLIKTDALDTSGTAVDDAGDDVLLHHFQYVATSEDFTDCVGRLERYSPSWYESLTEHSSETWHPYEEGTKRVLHEGTRVELQRDELVVATFAAPAVTASLPVRDADGGCTVTTTDTITQTLHRVTTSQAADAADPAALINSATTTALGMRSAITVFDPVVTRSADGTVTTTLCAETRLGGLEVVYTHAPPAAGGGAATPAPGASESGEVVLTLSPPALPPPSVPSATTVTPIVERIDTTVARVKVRWGVVDRGGVVSVETRHVGAALPDGAAHRVTYAASGVDETGGLVWVTRQPWTEEWAGDTGLAGGAGSACTRQLAPAEYFLAPAAERFIAGFVNVLTALRLQGAPVSDAILPAVLAGLEFAAAAAVADVSSATRSGDPLFAAFTAAATSATTAMFLSAVRGPPAASDVAASAVLAACAAAVRVATATGAIPAWAPFSRLPLPLGSLAAWAPLALLDTSRAVMEWHTDTWSRKLCCYRGVSNLAGTTAGAVAPAALYAAGAVAADVVGACAPIGLSVMTGLGGLTTSAAAAVPFSSVAAPCVAAVSTVAVATAEALVAAAAATGATAVAPMVVAGLSVAAVAAATAGAATTTRNAVRQHYGLAEQEAAEQRVKRETRLSTLSRDLCVPADLSVGAFGATVSAQFAAAAKYGCDSALAKVCDLAEYVRLRIELGEWDEFCTGAAGDAGAPDKHLRQQPTAALCALTLLNGVDGVLREVIAAHKKAPVRWRTPWRSLFTFGGGGSAAASPPPPPPQAAPAPPIHEAPAPPSPSPTQSPPPASAAPSPSHASAAPSHASPAPSHASAAPLPTPRQSPPPASAAPSPSHASAAPSHASAAPSHASAAPSPTPRQSPLPASAVPTGSAPTSALAGIPVPLDAYVYVALLAATLDAAAGGSSGEPLAAWRAVYHASSELAAAAAAAQPSFASRLWQSFWLPGASAPAESAEPARPTRVEKATAALRNKEAAWVDAVPLLRKLQQLHWMAAGLLQVRCMGAVALEPLQTGWPTGRDWPPMPATIAGADAVDTWVDATLTVLCDAFNRLGELPPLLIPYGDEFHAYITTLYSVRMRAR